MILLCFSRTNLLPDGGSVFDYNLDPTKPGMWFTWLEQVTPEQVKQIRELNSYWSNPNWLKPQIYSLINFLFGHFYT